MKKLMILLTMLAVMLSASAASPKIVHALNAYSLIHSVGNNVEIRIGAGNRIFLSDPFTLGEEEAQEALADVGVVFLDEDEELVTGGDPIMVARKVYDGYQLEIHNVENLTIVGADASAALIAEPRYARVLKLCWCKNVKFKNLVMGHTEDAPGSCIGGVLQLENCENVTVENCRLYGCGTYGIEAEGVANLKVDNSIVHNCTEGIFDLKNVKGAAFKHCDFLACEGGVDMAVNCYDVVLNDCKFDGNSGSLFYLQSLVKLQGCEIHHPFAIAGDESVDFIEKDKATTVDTNSSTEAIPFRKGTGPKALDFGNQ